MGKERGMGERGRGESEKTWRGTQAVREVDRKEGE